MFFCGIARTSASFEQNCRLCYNTLFVFCGKDNDTFNGFAFKISFKLSVFRKPE